MQKSFNCSRLLLLLLLFGFLFSFFLSFAFSSFQLYFVLVCFFARRIKITTDFSLKESKKLDLRGKIEKGKNCLYTNLAEKRSIS